MRQILFIILFIYAIAVCSCIPAPAQAVSTSAVQEPGSRNDAFSPGVQVPDMANAGNLWCERPEQIRIVAGDPTGMTYAFYRKSGRCGRLNQSLRGLRYAVWEKLTADPNDGDVRYIYTFVMPDGKIVCVLVEDDLD